MVFSKLHPARFRTPEQDSGWPLRSRENGVKCSRFRNSVPEASPCSTQRPLMLAPRSHGLPSPTVCAVIVVSMVAMIALPAAITLRSVQVPGPPIPVNQSSTPYGYTITLLLFIVPIIVIAVWFLPSEGLHVPRRAVWRTTSILVPPVCLLDLAFPQGFFAHPHSGPPFEIHSSR